MFLSKQAVGLQITDKEIYLAKLVKQSKQIVVQQLVHHDLPSGLIENNVIKDEQKLSSELQNSLSKIKAKNLYFCLPDSLYYFHVFFIQPSLDKTELRQAILTELQENIPIEVDNAIYNYKILADNKDQMKVALLVADKNILNCWRKVLKSVNIELDYFITEASALSRSLFPHNPSESSAIICLEGYEGQIIILDDDGLYSSGPLRLNKYLTKDIDLSIKYYEDRNKKKVKNLFILGFDNNKILFNQIKKQLSQKIKPAKIELSGKKVAKNYIKSTCNALSGLKPDLFKSDIFLSASFTIKSQPSTKAIEEISEHVDLKKNKIDQKDNGHKNKILILLSILLIGAILIGIAFWFRQKNQLKKQQKLQNLISNTLSK